jgi:antitoxin component YwqK of YwqJK toxin-antitoxin module
MIKSRYFIIAFILIPVFLNECNSGDKPGKPRKEKTSIQKVYSRSGMLVSEITMKDGVRHGPTTNYYQSGKVQSVINFENGSQQGESVWYYEDGKPYQVTQYINDKKEGIQKKYYKSGKILAEVPFFNDEQQTGIKEYTETGELITDYPEIIFEKPVKTSSSGQFILRMHLSDNSKEAVFEQMMINGTGDTVMAKVATKEGIGEIPFFAEKGTTVAAQIQVRAKTRTRLKNIYIAERQYYVKIKN